MSEDHGDRLVALVVEDEAPVREALIALLEERNYETRWASGMAAALDSFGERPKPSALVTDIVIDDGDGWKLCRSLRRKAPELAIVVVSGDPTAVELLPFSEADAVLIKPVDVGEIDRVIRERLGAARR